VLREMGARALPADGRSGVVVTAHRATNVDDPERLERLVELVTRVSSEIGPVIFPLHPRTRDRLVTFDLFERLNGAAAVQILDPLPYREMIDLQCRSRLIVTDSGGLQEEASWLGLPAVVLRDSTPRWEGVAAGSTALVGRAVEAALEAAAEFVVPDTQARIAALPCPYGDGHTGERVAGLLEDPAIWDLLRLDEPDGVPHPAALFGLGAALV
jgi:UDP-N-acetylglucosamine 2-epimerase (non-hydrolysing)